MSEAQTLTTRALPLERITPLADATHLYVSGMGHDAAQRAAQALIHAGSTALISFGTAGGLQSELLSGALFCPERILDAQGNAYIAHAGWRDQLLQRLSSARFPIHRSGALISVTQPLLTAKDKIKTHQRYAAAAVDMESAAIAAVAQQHDIPFIALRAIVDQLDDVIPTALFAGIDAWGRPLPLKMTRALICHPSSWKHLPGLAKRMRLATDTLRATVSATTLNFGLQ